MEKTCPICNNKFNALRSKTKYCSRNCYWKSIKGKEPWNKGIKTGKNYNLSKALKGKTAWNKGLPAPWMIGKNNPKWNGGNSRYYKEGYYSKEYLEWRMQVFTRDNFTCQECGAKNKYITAHHIKSWVNYPELRFNINNGKTLCEDCHSLTDNYRGRAKGKK